MLKRHKMLTRCFFQQQKTLYRCYTQSSCIKDQVRVRFAPSPTGHLHLGGLRTALYNYLYAKSRNGKFLLRIEDTDQTRLVPGATECLIEDLLWTGIEIDEGPGFGGVYGPYVQSERTDIYAKAVTKLLENNTAYRCFCTERRLELLRKEAARTRQIPRYDNKCRHLSKAQVDEQLNKGTPFCIRFRLSAHIEPLNDIIYGAVQHNVAENEGDPVIIKSDNFPTYHFANVVDDHLMGITHVFRGVEWQISTTKHLLLYKAFGWQPPEFGHLPLLINADGTKLSKRQGDIGIKNFRDKGYFPEALVNYVVTAGGGFQRNQQQTQRLQIYSMSELASQFNIKLVNAHPSRLNSELLEDLNRLKIENSLANKKALADLITQVQTLVKLTYPTEKNLDLSEKHIENILRWSVNRLNFIGDLCTPQLSFLWVRPTKCSLQNITTVQLEKLSTQLQIADFNKQQLSSVLKLFAKSEGLSFPELMKSLRSILSGLKEGPGVAEMMEILGKDAVIQRIQEALKCESRIENYTQRQAKMSKT